jgi:hypothetical protein
MPIIKNQDLDLDAFLHNVTCSPIKEINKQFNNNLDNTINININLNQTLNFDPIKYYFKSHISSCTNGMILNITFKFMVGLNIWLIFNYFYALRKKQQLLYITP